MRRTYGSENSPASPGLMTPASGSAITTPSAPASRKAWP